MLMQSLIKENLKNTNINKFLDERNKSIYQPTKLETAVEALNENGFESVTLAKCEDTVAYKIKTGNSIKKIDF